MKTYRASINWSYIKRERRGATLLEFVAAISISAVLVVGLHSSLFVALRGLPSSQGNAATAIQANRFLDSLSAELESAIYVSELTATSIAFSVPDRDADGMAERIRYAWSGTAGGPLTRRYNGGTIQEFASSVDLFSLTPSYQNVAETYPALCVEDAAESLLVNCYSNDRTSDDDVTSSNWIAQRFTLNLPAGAYAWRPTRVQFIARRESVPGQTLVQMRPATAGMSVSATVLAQQLLNGSALGNNFGWQSFTYSQLETIPSGGAICLVLQHQSGSKSLRVETTKDRSGIQKSNNAGASWSYDNSRSVNSQLYGKLLRSSGTTSINSKYLTSLDMSMRVAATSPTLRTTTVLLNHPELLTGKWELSFDRDPTQVDVNGDGASDWLADGGAFNPASLVNRTWQTSGTRLKTSTDCDFSKTTIIDLKFQNTSVGGSGATFTINALRSGSSSAPLFAYLRKLADGTQTLLLTTNTSQSQTRNLLDLSGLPNAPVSLRLIVNPVTSSINIRVNDVQYGTYALTPHSSTIADRFAMIGASGSTAEFSYARIRVLSE